MARTWQGTLHWHEQPWFAASGETSGLKREASAVARTAKTLPRAVKDDGRAGVARASRESLARVSSARGVDAAGTE
jgi:hypothetical protein